MFLDMTPDSSPSSSPSGSKPISIGSSSSASSTSSSSSFSSLSSSISISSPSSRSLTCAYPSWPTRSSLSAFHGSVPSSFISDEDLFGDFDDLSISSNNGPYLLEAPAPPRDIPVVAPLAPLYASEKPKSKKRRASRKSPSRHSKPMTPISE